MDPSEVVSIGEEIEVVILGVDVHERKIGLSRKRLLKPEEVSTAKIYNPDVDSGEESEEVWASCESFDRTHPNSEPEPPPQCESEEFLHEDHPTYRFGQTTSNSPIFLGCFAAMILLSLTFGVGYIGWRLIRPRNSLPAPQIDRIVERSQGSIDTTRDQRDGVPPVTLPDTSTQPGARTETVLLKTTEPYFEDFRSVGEGYLPSGWTGSQFVGVRTSSDLRWLASSSLERQTVTTKPLVMGNEFELELWIYPYSMSLELNGDRPLHVDLHYYSFGGELVATIPNTDEKLKLHVADTSVQKLRIVKVGRQCHICARDQRIVTQLPSENESFNSLSITLTEKSLIYGLALYRHPRPLDVVPLPFAGKFSETPEGERPPGWTGAENIIIRKQGSDAWLENAAGSQGIQYIRTPSMDLSNRFSIEFVMELGEWNDDFHVSLESAGPGEDMCLVIDGFFEKRNISLSNTRSVSFKQPTDNHDKALPLTFVLERDGQVFKLSRDGNTLVVSPRIESRRFHQLAFGLSGRAKLRELSVWDTDTGKPLPMVRTETRPPAEAPVVSGGTPIEKKPSSTTVWKTENGRNRFSITRRENTLQINLIESRDLQVFRGSLQRDNDASSIQYSGKATIIFNDDKTERERSVDLVIRVSSPTELLAIGESITFDKKSGREVSRKEDRVKWLRVEDGDGRP